ncbi:MAG: hypothetical protein H5T69_05075 [Chloroflexi bacterium]|nr:hypothetical protein [Chloroflexota bacterium]
MKRVYYLLAVLVLIGCGSKVPTPTPIDILSHVQQRTVVATATMTTAAEQPLAPGMAYPAPVAAGERSETPAIGLAFVQSPAGSAYPAPEAATKAPTNEEPPAGQSSPTPVVYPPPDNTTPSPQGEPTTPSTEPTATEAVTAAPSPLPSRTPLPTLTRPPTSSPTPTRLVSPLGLPDTGPVGRRSNIGPYLLMSPEAGQPTHNLLRDGPMRAYMAINPAHWGPADQLPNMEGYGRNWIKPEDELDLIRDGAEGGRRYFERFAQTYEQTRGSIHAWMSTWAFVYGDRGFAEQWVAFQREWLRLMHEHGYRAGVGGMKTHLFHPGEFAWLAPAIAEADYLFLAESGAPTLRGSFGQTTLLYRDLMVELLTILPPERIPPLILDVCVDGKVNADLNKAGGPWWQRGYRDFGTSQTDYAADVRAYDLETLKDPYVKHVFWFATNITKDTQSFDVNTEMLAIAEGWHMGQ